MLYSYKNEKTNAVIMLAAVRLTYNIRPGTTLPYAEKPVAKTQYEKELFIIATDKTLNAFSLYPRLFISLM